MLVMRACDSPEGTPRCMVLTVGSCKRRKERCDGSDPCGRCKERGVENTCCFKTEVRPRRRRTRADTSRPPSPSLSLSVDESQNHDTAQSTWTQDSTKTAANTTAQTSLASESPNSIEVDHSRFIQDRRGRYIFIGDSANLSFLSSVRGAASIALGSCPFVDDPLRSSIVEICPDFQDKPFGIPGEDQVPQLSVPEAERLVHNFFGATQGCIDLFDKSDVLAALPRLLSPNEKVMTPLRATLFLVLAKGAQMEPDMDKIADAYFTHGRFLGGQFLTEDVSIHSTQLYLLISIYLLGASRRNAAFVVLGQAVRSAYALGIHQRSNAALFSKEERRERERLWRTIRMMDLFTSGSLGRPPSTAEDKAFGLPLPSEMDDLFSILETILLDVYAQRKITTETLTKVGARQRKWAANFARISSTTSNTYERGAAGNWPDIKSMHIKQFYYWTIMLLTRPFLVDRVTAHAKAIAARPKQPIQACVQAEPAKTLIYASVDSAIKTVSLMEPMLTAESVPAHSPVLINAVFHAAVVLGFSYFGDLYTVFPLERSIRKAYKILCLFPHDSIAVRYVAITQYLREACSAYFDKRHATSMHMEGEAISRLFGQIHMPRQDKAGYRDAQHQDNSGVPEYWPIGGRAPDQSGTGATPGGQTANTGDEGLDTFMFSSSDVCSENDLLAQLHVQCDLNLDFPMTTQHVWLDTETFPSIFADMEIPNQGVSFM